MSTTFNDLLNQTAFYMGWTRNASVDTVPTDRQMEQLVNAVNTAIRWAWGMDDSRFAWPQTLTAASSVTVTDGVIAWADVGSSDWVSFWRSDPRVPPSNIIPAIPFYGWGFDMNVPPVPVMWDGTQFNVQDSSVTSPVFAFYRTATPQGTFALSATNPTYTTPTVPDFFKDPVCRYATAELLSVLASADREQQFRGKAVDWYDSNKASILNSDAGYPWHGNVINT